MTIRLSGYVKISTLNSAQSAKGTTPHQAALETIYDVVVRNTKLDAGITAAIDNNMNKGKYVGWTATYGMDIRSCHGDANLQVPINGNVYNSVEPQANPSFKNGNVEKIWWDYARNASTQHIANPAVDMAALVEFNCSTFMHQSMLNNLQTQTPFNNNAANANQKINIAAAGNTALPEPDGPRVLWHILGDFFIYSPDHYKTGYVVVDDNNDLFQTKNFF